MNNDDKIVLELAQLVAKLEERIAALEKKDFEQQKTNDDLSKRIERGGI